MRVNLQNFVSFIVFGGIFGAIVAGSIAEKIGRKITILISLIIMLTGNIILVIGNNIDLLCAMRILQGFGMGVNMMVCQVYISESTPVVARGAAVQSYVFFLYIGFIASHVSSLLNAYKLKLIFSLGLIPAGISFLLIIITQKESPTWVS